MVHLPLYFKQVCERLVCLWFCRSDCTPETCMTWNLSRSPMSLGMKDQLPPAYAKCIKEAFERSHVFYGDEAADAVAKWPEIGPSQKMWWDFGSDWFCNRSFACCQNDDVTWWLPLSAWWLQEVVFQMIMIVFMIVMVLVIVMTPLDDYFRRWVSFGHPL